jgi:MFS family permease
MSTMREKNRIERIESSDSTKIEKALDTDLDSFIEDHELDRRLNRKFDTHILPWLFLIWLFSFIDRSNIGNARIAGLTTELGIAKGTKFNVALLVFYIPYILVDVPSNLLVKKLRAGIYLPSLITGWGLVCVCMGFVKSFAGLIACRLLLGLFEGGILGGVIIYLAMFYRRHSMMLRNGLFYCAAPLSGAFGGLLATGLAKIQVGGYDKWPWIFFSALNLSSVPEWCVSDGALVEGAMTVVFGITCFFFMPDTPAAAGFLTDEEKEWALVRMRIDAGGSATAAAVEDEEFSWYWVKMALMSPQTYFCSFIWFFLLVPLYVSYILEIVQRS